MQLETPINSPSSHLPKLALFSILVIVGGLSGFLVSYFFTPRYTSQALVHEPPPLDVDLAPTPIAVVVQRLESTRQLVLTHDRLLAMLRATGLGGTGDEEQTIEKIMQNSRFEPYSADPTGNAGISDGKDSKSPALIFDYYVTYTDASPQRAQQICSALASLLLQWSRDYYQSSLERQTAETHKFIDAQMADVKGELEADQLGLRNCKHQRTPHPPLRSVQCAKFAADYAQAKHWYTDLLNKKGHWQANAEEQKKQLNDPHLEVIHSASLPTNPDLPNRFLCAAVGLAAGFVLGVGLLLL